MEIEQTVRQLETNAHANFTMAENAAYQCMANGWGNMPTLTRLWVTVCISYNIEKSQGPRQVLREHAECFLSIVRHTNAEQRYHYLGTINTLLPYNSTERAPLTFPAVTCCTFPLWT